MREMCFKSCNCKVEMMFSHSGWKWSLTVSKFESKGDSRGESHFTKSHKNLLLHTGSQRDQRK